jgi:hypothetical protein
MSADIVRDHLVQIALREVGVTEDPKGSNMDTNGRIREYNNAVNDSRYEMKDGDSYCASFVSWVYAQAGVPILHDYGSGLSYVPYMVDFAKSSSRWIPATEVALVKIGDAIITSENGSRPDHTGVVVGFSPESILTVEGNYNNGVNQRQHTWGSQSILGFLIAIP